MHKLYILVCGCDCIEINCFIFAKNEMDRIANNVGEVCVSVICTAYNQEKYIRDTLDGFLLQKTNFPFEIIIHDDASTDGTAEIIREYAERYPGTIIPIYQTQNLYSQGVPFIFEYIIPKAKGKYIAYCEGDDYWIDSLKLQHQYDFMESHSDYIACGHNVIMVEDDNSLMNRNSPLYSAYFETYTDMEDHDYTLEEVEHNHMYGHTCTRMYRNFWSDLPKDFMIFYKSCNCANEDLKLSLLCYCMGKVRCMSGQYAHHRKSVKNNSYTAQTRGKNLCKIVLKGCRELEMIAGYFNIYPDFSAVYVGNINSALLYWVKGVNLENMRILLYVLFCTPHKFKILRYVVCLILMKIKGMFRGVFNGGKF